MGKGQLPPVKLVYSVECKQGAVRAVRFNKSGEYCLTSGSDKTVKLWNPHKALFIKQYSPHTSEVLDAVACPDSSQIGSAGSDKQVSVTDVEKGVVLRKWRAHLAPVNTVRYNELGTCLLSGSQDGTARVWDCKSRSAQPIQTLDASHDAVTYIHIVEHNIFCACADGMLIRYDVRNGQATVDRAGHCLSSVSTTRDSKCALVSDLNDGGVLRLVELASAEILNEYRGHSNRRYRVESAILASNRFIITGSEDSSVVVYDLLDARVATKLKMQRNGVAIAADRVVNAVASHPTADCFIVACENAVYMYKDEEAQLISLL